MPPKKSGKIVLPNVELEFSGDEGNFDNAGGPNDAHHHVMFENFTGRLRVSVSNDAMDAVQVDSMVNHSNHNASVDLTSPGTTGTAVNNSNNTVDLTVSPSITATNSHNVGISDSFSANNDVIEVVDTPTASRDVADSVVIEILDTPAASRNVERTASNMDEITNALRMSNLDESSDGA